MVDIYLRIWVVYGVNVGKYTKTNIAPENGPFQKETSIPTIHFQVLC